MPHYKVQTDQGTLEFDSDQNLEKQDIHDVVEQHFSSPPPSQPSPTSPSLLRRGAEAIVKSPALPIAGGITGGIVGGGLASIPLAGLGAAGGEGFRQAAAHLMGIEAPRTVPSQLMEMGKQGLIGAAGEGGGQIVERALAPLALPVGRALAKGASRFAKKLTSIPTEAFETALEHPARLFTAPTKKTVEKAYTKAGFPLIKQETKEIISNPQLMGEVIEKATHGPKAMVKRGVNALKEFVENGTEKAKQIVEGRKGLDQEISTLKNQIELAREKGKSSSAFQTALNDKFKLRQLFNESLDKMAPALREADAQASKNLSIEPFRKPFLPGQFHVISPRGLLSIVPGLPSALGASASAVGAAGKAITSPIAGKAVSQSVSQALAPALITLTEKKAKEFYKAAKKKFKGLSDEEIRQKAREAAKSEGYEIPTVE